MVPNLMLERKIEEKKKQRAREEKEAAKAAEIARRAGAKEARKIREQYEETQRKLRAEQRKKDKEFDKRYREKIRKKLEQDKRERQAKYGKLPGAGGSEGSGSGSAASASPVNVPAAKKPKTSTGQSTVDIDSLPDPSAERRKLMIKGLSTLRTLRAGNVGLTAVKTLAIYVGNVAKAPEEVKFRRLNTDGKAYKKRVRGAVGAKGFLRALGFRRSESETGEDGGDVLILPEGSPSKETLDFAIKALADARAALERGR